VFEFVEEAFDAIALGVLMKSVSRGFFTQERGGMTAFALDCSTASTIFWLS